MRWLKPFSPLVLVFLALPARAQDAAPQPPEPSAPAEPPSPRQPPPQVFDGEQPPAPARPAPVAATPRRRAPVVEEKTASTGFGLELSTVGFASGTLQGGMLLGAHTPGGTIFGLRFNYRDETTKVAGSSNSKTTFSVGLAGRFPVAGSPDGLDLALAADAAFLKVDATATSGSAGSKGSGYQFAFGPQLRYWFYPNLAVGYLAQFSYASVSSDESADTSKVEQSVTAIVGSFTLTAGF